MMVVPFKSLPNLITKTYQYLQIHSKISWNSNIYDLHKVCEALDRFSKDPSILLAQALLYHRLSRWEDAHRSIDKARSCIKNKLQLATCHYSKGKIFQSQEQYDASVEEMREVFGLAGHNRIIRAYALIGIGWSHFCSGNYDVAESFLYRALQSRVEEIRLDCRRRLGVIASYKGDYYQADKYLNAALEGASPRDELYLLHCRYDMALSAERQKKYERALSLFQEAKNIARTLRKVDELARISTRIAQISQEIGQLDDALKSIKAALSLSPFVVRRHEIIDRFICKSGIELHQAEQADSSDKADELRLNAHVSLELGQKIASQEKDYRRLAKLWNQRGIFETQQNNPLAALRAFDTSQRMLATIRQSEKNDVDRQADIERDFDYSISISEQISRVHDQLIKHSPYPIHPTWRSTSVDSEMSKIERRSYSDSLTKELIPELRRLNIPKVRVMSEPLARMLGVFVGTPFKNMHYTYLGYAWTTATLHLRHLTLSGILTKSGHAKGAQYRLNVDLCPLSE
ncbi:MAG: hypothetical protein B6244_13990 [Candidatus Cloacimonetes bacterium 4572_55]|nr:MAG: hypothetical protein B6244_13990 [Candidatus Cloacimonetes bacterium 4572_55]